MTQIKTQHIIEEFRNKFAVENYPSWESFILKALQSQHQSDIEEFKRLCEGKRDKWISDAIIRDEHGGSGKETAKIIISDIIQSLDEEETPTITRII